MVAERKFSSSARDRAVCAVSNSVVGTRFSARGTLGIRVELIRQLRRRRTLVAYLLVVALPVVVVAAVKLGPQASSSGGGGGFGGRGPANVHLPDEPSVRELHLACRLLAEIVQLQRRRHHDLVVEILLGMTGAEFAVAGGVVEVLLPGLQPLAETHASTPGRSCERGGGR